MDGTQLHHHLDNAQAMEGTAVVIIGDSDQAIQAALTLSGDGPHRASSVTLVHRRDSFKAQPLLVECMRQRCETGAMQFVAGQPAAVQRQGQLLVAIDLALPDGDQCRLPLDHLLVMQGLSPRLGPVSEWGLDMEHKLLRVDTERFATREPDIFAVGDILSLIHI